MYDFSDGLGYFDKINDLLQTVGSLLVFNNILAIILGIGLIAATYFVYSYVLMFQGRKAGLRSDWFAFVPVARSIYRLDMVGEDRWKIIFIGGVSGVIRLILILLLMLFIATTNVVVSVLFEIILLVFLGFSIFFTYKFNRKIYALFNFNEHFALLNLSVDVAAVYVITACLGGFVTLSVFVGLVAAISTLNATYLGVFNFITAFDNRCQVVNNGNFVSGGDQVNPQQQIRPNRGQIMCTSGMYKDAVFQVENDFEIIIGRDSYFASIVITENSKSVSRKHCGIRYDSSSGNYIVTDYSSNGTYTGDGQRLQRNAPQQLSAGTSIYLGDKVNRFKLM